MSQRSRQAESQRLHRTCNRQRARDVTAFATGGKPEMPQNLRKAESERSSQSLRQAESAQTVRRVAKAH